MASRTNQHSIMWGTGYKISGTPSRERQLVTTMLNELGSVHVIGKSGSGKTYTLVSLAVQCIANNIGVTIITPESDLPRLIFKQLIATGFYDQPDAFEKVLWLPLREAAQRGLYAPINVLKAPYSSYTIANNVLEAFHRAFPSLQSGSTINVEVFLKLSAYLLCENKLSFIPHIYHVLTHAAFREMLLTKITDSLVREFFQHFDETLQRQSSTEALLKRVLMLCMDPLVRYSLSHQENILEYRDIIAKGKSVILDISGDMTVTRLLGSLVTVAFEQAALARADIPPEQRTTKHVIIIDEAPVFTAQSGDALAHLSEQARKFGCFIVYSHQGWHQLDTGIRGALRNCKIEVTGKLERPDAEISYSMMNFPYHMYWQKPEAINPFKPYSSPKYYSRTEQADMWIDALTQLDTAESFIRLPKGDLYKIRSLVVDNPKIESRIFHSIQDEYFGRYFKPAAQELQGIECLASFGDTTGSAMMDSNGYTALSTAYSSRQTAGEDILDEPIPEYKEGPQTRKPRPVPQIHKSRR